MAREFLSFILGNYTHCFPASSDAKEALRQHPDQYVEQVQKIVPHVATTSTLHVARDELRESSICNGLCQRIHALDDLPVTTSAGSLDGTPIQQMERLYEDDSLSTVFPELRQTLQEVDGNVLARKNSEAKTSQKEALIAAQRRTRRLSSYIGKIDWKLDSKNTAIAGKAFSITRIENLGWDEKERRGFLYSQLWLGGNLNALCGDTWIIDARQLLLARKLEIIERLPKLPLDELDDRNKGDLIVKIFAMYQIAWLFVQVMIRLINGTPITQLEVMATAFAACSLLTYFLLLDRPQDIQTACTVAATRYPSPDKMLRIANSGPRTWGGSQKYPWIPNNAIHWDGGASLNTAFFTHGAICCMIIFGGFHCLAWNSEFSTHFEAIVWRLSTIVTIATLPTAAVLSATSEYFHEKRSGGKIVQARRDSDTLMIFLNHYIFGPIFAAARIFIAVEAIRSLVFQPSTVFLATHVR